MFFIMGISTGQRKLDFDQVVICPYCGQYGHVQVIEIYTCLSLFFIPVLKWNRHYVIQMSCCGATRDLAEDTGREIAKGRCTQISMDRLPFREEPLLAGKKCCRKCGYETDEDFAFCPQCGEKLN